ncbi:putative SKP1/BTB/POZ domain, NPH3 domain-containing protein [Rosa chinensis]|uniref:Putative SKP1/BTB/POZ domain, NPH3 domain-containing protein n=1 Tax=Rosa chinensis TaxID=74649 RepID=A0A2P6RAV5_ROSCH|nr:BTB/POZ domain-containing protein At5g03250 [Rosa chinensis]XP_040373109.1 BTB/POZ domain-containing protein At5g03250 [Rosa chinensis]PRQ43556.1 putative SKP1/BTB/POZ domain, NPH3 domain-containing protein [Rosa chinensis]
MSAHLRRPPEDMACVKLGVKSEAFHREGQTWVCTTGLPSDIIVQVGEMSFHLHKFPLLSKSGLLEQLIEQCSMEESSLCALKLHGVPGGAKAFELVTKFCYGVKIELTALNVVILRCAAEYLRMTEEYEQGNLIAQTEVFLNEVFGSWRDSIIALETCEEVQPYVEELHIVSRCIDSLATKACSDPKLFSRPMSGGSDIKKPTGTVSWNGIAAESKPQSPGENWWYEDTSFLSLPLYKRLIQAVESKGMRPESIAASLITYARKYLPLMNRLSSFNDANHANSGTNISDEDQRVLLEEIVGLLPNKKGVTSSKFLLRLLRTAMILHASQSCTDNLEKRVGTQLDQAVLIDLLIPNMGYSVETLYDIDCIQRILDHFMLVNQPYPSSSPCIIEEGQLMTGTDPLTPVTMVASLVDGYLAEVAPDVNLKLPKFQALAAVIPEYARPLDDGIYHAIDVFLKAHPWLTDAERELLCRLMNCNKLSLEASTHAAQNERLPLRVIVQVLFFEQLRLRTSISGWLFVDNLENSQNPSGNLGLPSKNDGSNQVDPAQVDRAVGFDHEVRERVLELQKECSSMKKELQKLVKNKRSWSILPIRLGFRKKVDPCCPKESKASDRMTPASCFSGQQNHVNGEVPHSPATPQT